MVWKPTINPDIDIKFLKTLSPERRKDVEHYLLMHESDINDLIKKIDPDIADTVIELHDFVRNENLLNTAGKGYRKLGEELKIGPEKGKFELIPDKPAKYEEENQDILDLLAMMKEYDFLMSGDRIKHDKAHAFLQNRIYEAVKEKIKTTSIRNTGKGGVISSQERMNHPELKQIDDNQTLYATTKFLTSNMSTNEIGQQPSGMIDNKGNLSSIPVEHTEVSFKEDPSRGLDPENRDLGSTLPNSITRAEPSLERKLELLYNNIADKAEYIEATYGVPYNTLMKEKDWMYKVDQNDWDPNKYSGLL